MTYPRWLKGVLLAGFVLAMIGCFIAPKSYDVLFPAGLLMISFVGLYARWLDRRR